MGKEEKKPVEKPLRLVSPKLYRRFLTEMETFHIHSYDFKISAIEEENGLTIIVKLGEDLLQTKTEFFSFSEIEQMDQKLIDFFAKCGEDCKQVLIADYYKMMKP